MGTTKIIALYAAGLVCGVLLALWIGGGDPPEPETPPATEVRGSAADEAGGGQPVLDGAALEALTARLAAIEALLRKRDAERRAPEEGGDAGKPAVEFTEEALRKLFQGRIDAMKRELDQLAAMGDGSPDRVIEMRRASIQRAQRLLDDAVGLEGLRRLSEGDHGKTFRMP